MLARIGALGSTMDSANRAQLESGSTRLTEWVLQVWFSVHYGLGFGLGLGRGVRFLALHVRGPPGRYAKPYQGVGGTPDTSGSAFVLYQAIQQR